MAGARQKFRPAVKARGSIGPPAHRDDCCTVAAISKNLINSRKKDRDRKCESGRGGGGRGRRREKWRGEGEMVGRRDKTEKQREGECGEVKFSDN